MRASKGDEKVVKAVQHGIGQFIFQFPSLGILDLMDSFTSKIAQAEHVPIAD